MTADGGLMLLPSATPESERRAALAAEFVRTCPPELGPEIAITGSVARGIADQGSDIELNLWADSLPPREAREDWLRAAGATEIFADMGSSDGSVWITCQFQGFWIEAGWQALAAQEQLLRGILTGQVLDSARFVMADTIAHAVPLRSNGALSTWQQQLAHYPEDLREQVIASNTAVWGMPHAVNGRWTLCRRGDEPALTQRLVWDFANIWSLLFALNHRWEPDRKWVRWTVAELAITPERLAERIDAVFGAAPPEQRIVTCFELILDTLALLPPSPGVKRAADTVRASLRGRQL
jgi:hypothetical protein